MAALSTFLVSLGLLGVSLALILAQRQHRLAQERIDLQRRELELQRDGVRAQQTLYALGLLRDAEFRKAVMVVRSRLQGRSVDSWETSDNFHVLLVCSTYNLLGLLLKHQLLPRELFLEHWGASVLDMYRALEEFITRRRRANPRYCADFLWLCEQAVQHHRSAATSGELPTQADPSLQGTASMHSAVQ